MPMVLIKNNLKLMLRSKGILVMMSLLPVITIALLSNAFHDMMNVNYEIQQFSVGYRFEDNLELSNEMMILIDICKENNIILENHPSGDITELVQDSKISVFVEINQDSYIIYKSEGKAIEAAIVESIFSSFYYEIQKSMTVYNYLMEKGGDVTLVESMELTNTKQYVQSIPLQVNPVPSSIDYYGIIEIVYFMWCGMVSLAAVISSERKNKIDMRIHLAPTSKLKLYLGKLVPCVIATCLEVGVALIISVSLFDIHWGNLLGSFGILLLLAVTSSAFGIVLFYLFNSVAISIVVAWIFLFAAGFLGGTFQTYMYSTIPDKIAMWSPQYYINRTLVEFSTMGKSAYAGKCVLILGVMLLVFVILGLLIMNMKKEDK